MDELAKIIDVHLIMNEVEDKINAYDIAKDIINNRYKKEIYGYWIDNGNMYYCVDHNGRLHFKGVECSVCKCESDKSNYCSNCGAKMLDIDFTEER